jgi:hypothetical protein
MPLEQSGNPATALIARITLVPYAEMEKVYKVYRGS